MRNLLESVLHMPQIPDRWFIGWSIADIAATPAPAFCRWHKVDVGVAQVALSKQLGDPLG